MDDPCQGASLVARLACLGAGLSGLVTILAISGAGAWVSFTYFTIQTNLLVVTWTGAALAWKGRDGRISRWFFSGGVQGGILVYISTTFIIFAVMLSPFWQPTGWLAFVNVTTHYIVPVAYIVDWLLTARDTNPYRWRLAAWWLLYPLLYLVQTLVTGAMDMPAPYYFVDVDLLGVPAFAVSVMLLAAWFAGLGLVIIAVNRRLVHRHGTT